QYQAQQTKITSKIKLMLPKQKYLIAFFSKQKLTPKQILYLSHLFTRLQQQFPIPTFMTINQVVFLIPKHNQLLLFRYQILEEIQYFIITLFKTLSLTHSIIFYIFRAILLRQIIVHLANLHLT
ncbi:transmembrane protein, putative, partial (macronuclear) [Tetrahymena thermophila SB210]